jgi:TolB-like protein
MAVTANSRRNFIFTFHQQRFRQSHRLKRFLTFIVEETCAGRGERLKEFVVGVQVFGKPEEFDPRTDPVVRVQARRLRAQLERYYRDQGQNDSVVIELPKGGYIPIIRHQKPVPPKGRIGPTLVSHDTVVVFPFNDYSIAGDQQWLCESLREEIVHVLTGLGNIRVIAREVRSVPQSEADIVQTANQLNAALVVLGSVRTAGEVARITTRVLDTATGCYLWSNSFNRKIEDTFAIQDEVAQAVGDQLTAQPGGISAARTASHRPENLAAYNLYLQGRYHLNQRTEEGLRLAAEFFDKAITEDAQYAQAYSGLADAYSLLGHYGVLTPAEVWTKTASNAAWAVLLDEHSAEAHASLAHVKATQDWDWLGAEREFQRAIGLDPRYPTARHWYATSCLVPLGRLDEAWKKCV